MQVGGARLGSTGGGHVGPAAGDQAPRTEAATGLVARPRLIDRLSGGAESALTLVSAPAGFGKTSPAGRLAGRRWCRWTGAAWLSLDQRDNDPTLFWTYLVAALQGVGSARAW